VENCSSNWQSARIARITGVGRGIAVALGSHGCIVYVIGGSQKPGQTENQPGMDCGRIERYNQTGALP